MYADPKKRKQAWEKSAREIDAQSQRERRMVTAWLAERGQHLPTQLPRLSETELDYVEGIVANAREALGLCGPKPDTSND